MSTIQHISLSQLSSVIEDALNEQLARTYWIVAEVSECNVNYSGHCYLELIDKPENSDVIVAKSRATIWAQTYRLISAYFKSATGFDLQAGMKVLFQVSVEYHKLYGMSLNVKDVDPTYTLGEDEKQRREILLRLEQEGIIDMNTEVELPEVIQKLAIISSPQAAGYQDFMNQLHNNEYGIVFYTTLFPASMQGLEVEQSIVSALNKIYEYENVFDAVIIIRGGGSKTDLRWFDNYTIAANIAQFPLPVISGIGHDKDKSIVDIVSNTSLKTPTAVADFCISKAHSILMQLEDLEEQILAISQDFVIDESLKIEKLGRELQNLITSKFHSEYLHIQEIANSLENASKSIIQNKQFEIEKLSSTIQNKVSMQMHSEQEQLQTLQRAFTFVTKSTLQKHLQTIALLETKLTLHNPQTILNKGYSVTVDRTGKVIKDASLLSQGDEIKTRLSNGNVTSIVK